MSDYLWDRTGERDAEVERLEALLGAFAHKPRPLGLPAEEPNAAARRAPRPSGPARRPHAPRLFSHAGLAAAAALALVIFGAAALLLQRARSENDGGAGAEQARPASSPESARGGPESTASVVGAKPEASEAVSKARASKVEKAAVENLSAAPFRRKGLRAASASGRERSAHAARGVGETDGVFTFEAMRAGGGASAFVESTRLVTKERLVYALRLTGAKLRDVRERAQGLEGADARPR